MRTLIKLTAIALLAALLLAVQQGETAGMATGQLPAARPATAVPEQQPRLTSVVLERTGREYSTLRAALDAAADHDRLLIGPGTYREGPIAITRPMTLIGSGWPELDGEGIHPILVVAADSVEIRGLSLRNSGMSHIRDHAAIRVEQVIGCVIAGNRLRENFFGIYLARTDGCVVSGNDIAATTTRESSTGNAIHLWNATNIRIDDNRIVGHRDGIYLEHASHISIRRNTSERALRYGLHFMFSNNTDYEDNVFRDNGAGVAVMYSRNVRILGNRFEDNWGSSAYGLLLKEIFDAEISGNTFERNTVAMHMDGNTRNVVRRNSFVRNGWAIKVMSNSRDNSFTENNFIDNSFDVATNSRQNFNTFDGNYWSRYQGYDLTGDGVGDIPHRPVRLFALIVERTPAALILLRSAFVDLLDAAERVLPVLTPQTLVDERPRMLEVTP
jgi:nitrous oxidase accessory protein